MTLDEAIRHAEEVAQACENQQERHYESNKLFDNNYDKEKMMQCESCANEHRQLAEWLRELKAVREAWTQLTETVTELRDNGGTGTQKDIAGFLVNYLGVLEKEIMAAKEG